MVVAFALWGELRLDSPGLLNLDLDFGTGLGLGWVGFGFGHLG